MFWANNFATLFLFFAPGESATAPLVEATGVQVDARYASEFNFLGRAVEGYKAPKCLLTKEAARALADAQKYVEPFGLSLRVFDCYRPQRSVTEFVNWVKAPGDEKMKAHFFPDEEKSQLIAHGYIDARSGHSRGSTLDLTLVKAGTPLSHESQGDCRHPQLPEGMLDMGTSFDCFSELAHTANEKVSAEARKNRLLLKAVMEKAGFVNYPKEWWHFSLKNEPYPDKFFDFPVE
jgi:D-alanyl-D-alanine dipeptidase